MVLSLWKGVITPMPYLHSGNRAQLRRVVVDEVVADVAARHGITPGELLGPRRLRHLIIPRQEAMYLLRAIKASDGLPKYSLPAIGIALGGRDHTTVLHGVRAHAARLAAYMVANAA